MAEITADGSYSGLNDFVDLLRVMQIQEDLDVLIGVSGFKGFGKSTFSKQVSKRYIEKYFKIPYNAKVMKKYTPYTVDDVFRVIDGAEEYAPIDADEAVNFALGEDWMRRHSKKLKKMFTKIRTRHHIFFFNIPDIWWLDKKYRENMMTIWVHMVKKGTAMVAFPNIAPGIEDRWYRKWLQKAFDKRVVTYFTPVETIMKVLRKYPCYFDEFKYPKLPERLYQYHLQIRSRGIMGEADEVDSSRDVIKAWRLQTLVPFHKWEDVVKMVKKSRRTGKPPTLKQYYKVLMYSPVRRGYLVSYRSFLRYSKEFEQIVKNIDKNDKRQRQRP